MINNIIYDFFVALGVTIIIYTSINKAPELKRKMQNTLVDIYRIISNIDDINPFILNYNTDSDTDDQTDSNICSELDTESSCSDSNNDDQDKNLGDERFEDKYLTKYKNFPNEFNFTKEELDSEIKELDRLHLELDKETEEKRNELKRSLSRILCIYEKVALKPSSEITMNDLINIFGLDEEEEDDDDNDINDNTVKLLEGLLAKLANDKNILEEELKKIEDEAEDTVKIGEKLKEEAHNFIINQKLDGYINNYILEPTPLGNIYMRWNNSKKSFEYFSNNTIPYRYLEPVGRKYIMTYWCKPIFIDIEEELKRAEERLQEEKNKKDNLKLQNVSNNVSMMAKLKPYNKDSNKLGSINNNSNMKNRDKSNFVLPPQIKANLPNVNTVGEKQLLKENSNRYTWEGRLTNFSPLKRVDKKIVNKKLALTFADFKKMQQK
jgi:hypothetical protein